MKPKQLSLLEYSKLSHKYDHSFSIPGNQFELDNVNRFIKFRLIDFEKFVVFRLFVVDSFDYTGCFFLKYNKTKHFSTQAALHSLFDFASSVTLEPPFDSSPFAL